MFALNALMAWVWGVDLEQLADSGKGWGTGKRGSCMASLEQQRH